MPLIEESYLQSLLNECDAYFTREEKQAKQAVNVRLEQIHKHLKKNIRESFANFSLDIIVRFMEISVEVEQKFLYAEEFVDLFFERVAAPSQFYIRALLVKAKYIAYNGHKSEYKGEAMVNVLKEAIGEINKALDLIVGSQDNNPKGGKDAKGAGENSSKAKYSFLIYNASTCLYKITRFLLRQHWQKNFTEIYERIYKLFEEVDQPDQNWRCRFTLILFQCLYDCDKKADAFKILDLLWERAKSKNWESLDSLFRLRVHLSKQNSGLVNSIKKDVEGSDPNAWKVLEVLQRMRSGAIPDTQIEKELMGVVNQISLGVLSSSEQTATITLPHVMQIRLGQAGRIALKYNLINIANSITNFLGKARQPNPRAIVLNEYNKAELLIKKKGEYVDKKTGMAMSAGQVKEMEIQNRKEALKLMQKAMIINKKQDNAELIYEGAILIWNISLPFMCPQYRHYISKALDISCGLLEQIDSVDHDLRTKMHLELANIYFGNEQMFSEVEKNIMGALKLDHSIPISKIQFKFESEEDPSLYHRPYERYLTNYREKIMLKTMQNMDPDDLDTVAMDLWNVVEQKSQTTRIDILQKCLKVLLNYEEPEYAIKSEQMLVEEEIKEEKIEFERKKLRKYKKRKILAAEVTQLAFEWQINQFAKKAAQFVLADTWEAKNSIELIIVQVRCCYFMAQIKIDELNQDNFQVPFKQIIRVEELDEKEQNISEEIEKKINKKKKQIFELFSKGLQLSQSIQQHWLVFNGAIYVWNNFLNVFRNQINDSKLHPDLCQLLKKFFETMKNSLKEIQLKNIVYYDLDTKIQTFANIGSIHARLMEHQNQTEQVIKICDTLLLTQLSPHSRKLINSQKARVGGGKAAGGKEQKKGGKDVPQEKAGGYDDSFVFKIFTQLQFIQNSPNKGETESMIKKCFEELENWQPKENDETELELHAELWARLARLALNEANATMYKYALRSAGYSLSQFKNQKRTSTIPANRIRWYSLAQFLYSQSMLNMANPETQQVQGYEKLLFNALEHAVEATFKGYKSNINALVVDAAKQVWNICVRLQQSQKNRAKLLNPLRTTLFYLKQIKQQNEVDLILLLSQLFFKAAMENNQYKIGQEVADMVFVLIPKNLQKSIWEAKMVFMSKQGKNELQAISNMKEADPSLQAKLWVRLARVANQVRKQHAAYTKAIDILKKQNSVEIVEVLIQYSEWQLRVGGEKVQIIISNLLLASDYLIDIEYGDQDDDEEGDDDKGTVFSRSTRGKKSQASKSIKSSVKDGKTKRVTEKKPSSNKSKAGSNISRMNRSSRVTKTIKSKNSKSIFSQRQEDPNPETLTCTHFQRLFRIHTILAMISDSVLDRIRYAEDALHFLKKILELSFKTINDIHENTVKFAENGKVDGSKRYFVPEKIKDWLSLELSKDFIDKIKVLEDSNFMGTYSFDKPQLTYIYLRHLSKIFNNYGLHVHTVPIFFFQKFISKEILGNKDFYQVSHLDQILCLKKIHYHDEKSAELTKIDPSILLLSEQSKKSELIKSKAKIVEDREENSLFQTSYPPNLVKIFTSHEAWLEIGKILIQFGEIYLAKEYIVEAIKHFDILGNIESTGECYIYLTQIADLQGQKKEALQYSMKANKMCKNSSNWQKLFRVLSKVMISLEKYEDLYGFGSKIYETVNELISECKREKSQKTIFEAEILDLKNMLILIEIADLDLSLRETLQEEIEDGSKTMEKSLAHISQRLSNDPLWRLEYYEYFFKIAKTIINIFIFGKGDFINAKTLKQIFLILLRIERNMFQLMKYALVSSSEEFQKNPLIRLYRKYRFLIVEVYIYQSSLKQSNISESVQDMDEVDELAEKNETFSNFMKTLNLQIQKKISPIPRNLQPFQSSLAILQNLKSNIEPNSYESIQWKIHYIRTLTSKALCFNQLSQVWQSKNQESMEDQRTFATESLTMISKFLSSGKQEQILNFSKNTSCYQLGEKLYGAIIENMGRELSEEFFQFLSKMQHCSYLKGALSILNQNLNPSHRLVSFIKMIDEVYFDQNKIEQTLEKNKIFTSLAKFPTYEQCLNLVPKNSVYAILQFSNDKKWLYAGFLINEKNEEEYQTRVLSQRVSITKEDLKTYRIMKNKMKKIQKSLSYLAYDDPEKLKSEIEEMTSIFEEVKANFYKKSQWWLKILVEVINQDKEAKQTQEAIDKNKKAPAKDQKKKGGKDQVGSYQSPLPPSMGGFQSIVFLVDQLLQGLPFESLDGLEKVPAISSESSLFFLSRKMQNAGFKSEMNNSNGLGGEKGKYISYDFNSEKLNFKAVLTEINKVAPSLKLDGLASSQRIPSIGDYQKYLSENGFLQIYGISDFLNYIKIPILLEQVGTAKCKLMIINDHLNFRKSMIRKYINLDDQSKANSIQEQSRILKLTANLLDLSIIKNRWPLNPEQFIEALTKIYQNLGSGYYLGAIKYSEQEKDEQPLLKYLFEVHGCPVLRM